MDSNNKMAPQTSLFQVYLRLRPPIQIQSHKLPTEPWLVVEQPAAPVDDDDNMKIPPLHPTHITLQPPNESRKRAIERFGFTKIFKEDASQLNIFEETGVPEAVKNVLHNGRDGLVATLGVTGSGKSHTILGSKTQRGLTQMTLDVLFQSIGQNIRRPYHPELPIDIHLLSALQASDSSEAQILAASTFLESIYGDGDRVRSSRAQTPMSRGQTPMTEPTHPTRRPPLPRPSTFAQTPDVSHYATQVDQDAAFVVLISMYEVYNDRIFDLLSTTTSSNLPAMSTRQGAALQKGLMRRPLLFKNTEMSPERKVVAGLRKIVCSTYEEAMMVLETGLTERRVAGTGSNSVSSRSHGFFCIEVKKNSVVRHYGAYAGANWSGSTLSIVDLAGSERARNAKTTGSTLAEAGKINESLMYLGQCLQVQSDCQQDGSKPIVPFRQCKLTELLFSNSFSTTNNQVQARAPQKAVMIVTADPQGDFNATSQILRYSALAREVTVPRVPSLTSTILNGTPKLPQGPSGRNSPHDNISAQELELAAHEIARLSEECDALMVRLAKEEIKRTEAELKLQAAEEKASAIEQEIREECWAEMEARLEEEKERWRTAWETEKMKNEEYMDGKLEILERTTTKFTIHEDAPSSIEREDELQRENEALGLKVRELEQELQTRSPTKRPSKAQFKSPPSPHQKGLGLTLHESTANTNIMMNPFLASLRAAARDSETSTIKGGNSGSENVNPLDVSPRKLSLRSSNVHRDSVLSVMSTNSIKEEDGGNQTVKKKQRKLTTRKWDLGDPEELC